jgi:o-succinylbenzoate synthase
MRVTRVAWAPFRIPFVTPYETALGASTHRSGLILLLEAGAGVRGLGEASLDPSVPERDAGAIYPCIDAIGRELLSAGPDSYGDVLDEHAIGDEAARAAHCAFETALADAGGRAANASLASMLAAQFAGEDAAVQNRVLVNATIAHRRTDAAARAALLAKAAGYACVKLKVGMEASPEAEASRVRTIREIIGPDVRLRLDANGAWDEATAIQTIRALEPSEIELIEQPVAAADIDALARVRGAVSVPVAADEAVVDYLSAERAIGSADAVVVKPIRLGGPSVTRYVAQHAAAAGLSVVVTTTIDTGIATAMALHIAASLPDGGRAHGLATASLLQHDLLTWPIAIERGVMRLPAGAGLGVDLDDDAAAKYLGEWHEVR